ncbi:MAG: pentapeptide repeat-containing protein [Deltaproteobacteria bacterium]|jgi:uncharacterized protein YjbI with pentapeptide repeats|nr:pentapeptide repeat-containing protein [Deltaproteobacteria bacterium]
MTTEVKRTPKPSIMYEENASQFNKLTAEGKQPDLTNANLSDLDLRPFNLKEANLSGCYLRGANLAGLDLSGACLHGASIKNARISGCLFPASISAEEISLSLDHGTRIRQPK